MSIEGATVVAIDDTASIRTFLRVSVENEGATMYEAATGLSGLEQCRTQQPDLVVLDLGLPDIDGMDVLQALKKQENPPIVIILSVRKNQQSFAEAAKLGADGYLTKPFLVEDLIELMEEKLIQRRCAAISKASMS